MIRPSLFAIAACALVGSWLLAGVALGESVTAVPTSATFSNLKSGVYEGVVSSNRGVCRNGRRVSVIEDRNHNGRSDHSDPTLAKTFSAPNGAYRANGTQAARGAKLLIIVGPKVLSRNAFCRPVIKNAAALSG
jgi:hypothetical protein